MDAGSHAMRVFELMDKTMERKPIAWLSAKTIERLQEQTARGASPYQISNCEFGRWVVPVYLDPPAGEPAAHMGAWTDDDRARAWRESFDSMHSRAMQAEAKLAIAQGVRSKVEESLRRHMASNPHAAELIKRIAFDIVPLLP